MTQPLPPLTKTHSTQQGAEQVAPPMVIVPAEGARVAAAHDISVEALLDLQEQSLQGPFVRSIDAHSAERAELFRAVLDHKTSD